MKNLTERGNYTVSITTCEIRMTSTNKPYRFGNCFVIEGDKTNFYQYKQWDRGDLLEPGIYRVNGGFQLYEGVRSFMLTGGTKKLEEKDVPNDIKNKFVRKNPNPDINIESIVNNLCNTISLIKNPFISKLVKVCLIAADWDWLANDWEERVEDLIEHDYDFLLNPNSMIYQIWGGKMVHHDYQGGLVYHSIEVCDIALAVMDRTMKDVTDRQRDIVIAGSLLHDIGKTLEFCMSGCACVTSKLGEFHNDHIILGARYVERVYRLVRHQGISYADPMILEEIIHIINSHHDEWFKRILPRTMAARLVCAGDLNSFRLARGRDHFLRNPESDKLIDGIGAYIQTN